MAGTMARTLAETMAEMMDLKMGDKMHLEKALKTMESRMGTKCC
jgi:riboflavin synthase alpha subunit